MIIIDIDECERVAHSCHKDADCTDNDGSFSCTCKVGFSGNGFFCERKSLALVTLLICYSLNHTLLMLLL